MTAATVITTIFSTGTKYLTAARIIIAAAVIISLMVVRQRLSGAYCFISFPPSKCIVSYILSFII